MEDEDKYITKLFDQYKYKTGKPFSALAKVLGVTRASVCGWYIGQSQFPPRLLMPLKGLLCSNAIEMDDDEIYKYYADVGLRADKAKGIKKRTRTLGKKLNNDGESK